MTVWLTNVTSANIDCRDDRRDVLVTIYCGNKDRLIKHLGTAGATCSDD